MSRVLAGPSVQVFGEDGGQPCAAPSPNRGQFQRGQSGNPKGRPRKVIDRTMPLEQELAKPMKIKRSDGKIEEVTTQEALRRRLLVQALSGSIAAFALLLKHCPNLLTMDVRLSLEQEHTFSPDFFEHMDKHMTLEGKMQLREVFESMEEQKAAHRNAVREQHFAWPRRK